jgi:hypothetical protein
MISASDFPASGHVPEQTHVTEKRVVAIRFDPAGWKGRGQQFLVLHGGRLDAIPIRWTQPRENIVRSNPQRVYSVGRLGAKRKI